MRSARAAALLGGCFCGNPELTHLMGAKVTHTPTRCHFTTGAVEHLRMDFPDAKSKDDAIRQIATAKPGSKA